MKLLTLLFAVTLLISCTKENEQETSRRPPRIPVEKSYLINGDKADLDITTVGSYVLHDSTDVNYSELLIILNTNTSYSFTFTSVNSSIPVVNDVFTVSSLGAVSYSDSVINITTQGDYVVFDYVYE